MASDIDFYFLFLTNFKTWTSPHMCPVFSDIKPLYRAWVTCGLWRNVWSIPCLSLCIWATQHLCFVMTSLFTSYPLHTLLRIVFYNDDDDDDDDDNNNLTPNSKSDSAFKIHAPFYFEHLFRLLEYTNHEQVYCFLDRFNTFGTLRTLFGFFLRHLFVLPLITIKWVWWGGPSTFERDLGLVNITQGTSSSPLHSTFLIHSHLRTSSELICIIRKNRPEGAPLLLLFIY